MGWDGWGMVGWTGWVGLRWMGGWERGRGRKGCDGTERKGKEQNGHDRTVLNIMKL